MWFANKFQIQTKMCWHTQRGKDLEPIMSCEGMGDQFYFYINLAFALAGTVAGALFLYGVLLRYTISKCKIMINLRICSVIQSLAG